MNGFHAYGTLPFGRAYQLFFFSFLCFLLLSTFVVVRLRALVDRFIHIGRLAFMSGGLFFGSSSGGHGCYRWVGMKQTLCPAKTQTCWFSANAEQTLHLVHKFGSCDNG